MIGREETDPIENKEERESARTNSWDGARDAANSGQKGLRLAVKEGCCLFDAAANVAVWPSRAVVVNSLLWDC